MLRATGHRAAAAVLAVCLVAGATHAADLAGAKDHPLISRFAGASLEAYKAVAFDEAVIVTKPLLDEAKPEPGTLVTLEGQVTKNGYVVRGGKSPLEVMRNYEQALAQAGFQTLFKCADWRACGKDMSSFVINSGKMATPDFPLAFEDDNRYLLARRENGQGTVHVVVYVTPDRNKQAVDVFQQVVESKPMATGQVQVLSAAALKQGLDADGKVAVYGVYFDTAAAQIKPESKPSLDEMAKLLANDKALKVYIVGHTDNAGVLAANLDLSQRRAEAVVKALVALKIDASRLVPKGVASLAPVASNSTDAGRAKNRRVELVVQ